MHIKEAITALPQYILPHHLISRIMGRLTHSQNKTWKNFLIRLAIRTYKINVNEALEQDLNAYASFNHFFTRALNPESRPIADRKNAVASPADGTVSQAGKITRGKIFQAKGKNFTAIDLLGGDQERAKPFENGEFATIYLSPKDYHRLHMPLAGTLKEMVHIPGRLFSVNAATTNSIPGLFARNERVTALFETEVGPMALVLVGAINVASIETVWDGVITPPSAREVRSWQYPYNPPFLKRGEEMGRFNMGSTIIVLFGNNKINWESNLVAGKSVNMGELIGNTIK